MADQIIYVVAAVIKREDSFLIAQRPDYKRHGGLWEFPGGKVHEGESLFDAVRRELHEELAVKTINIGDVLYTSRDKGSPFVIQFVETQITGKPTPLEHTELKWMTPEELSKMPLAPTDAQFVAQHLIGE